MHLTPEAVALTLEALAKRIRSRNLTAEEAARTLEHEARLTRASFEDLADHRENCPECRLTEPIEALALTG